MHDYITEMSIQNTVMRPFPEMVHAGHNFPPLFSGQKYLNKQELRTDVSQQNIDQIAPVIRSKQPQPAVKTTEAK